MNVSLGLFAKLSRLCSGRETIFAKGEDIKHKESGSPLVGACLNESILIGALGIIRYLCSSLGPRATVGLWWLPWCTFGVALYQNV
jgi:hypothetical protein